MNLTKFEMIGLGTIIGGAIGTALGAGLHEYGAWVPIGIGIGIAIALGVVERRECRPKSQRRAAGS
jgi:hypothetical protein